MKQLCSQVGRVIKFNIVFDRETGKSKGYGFCEYETSSLVDSAIDLLHDFEHRGASLYLRRPNQENKSAQKHSNSNGGNNNQNNKKNVDAKKKKKLLPTKRKSVDEITRVVDAFSVSDKREILSQMKVLIEQNADGAKEILISNPQLAQALLLIQMEFNLVKVQDVQALTESVNNQIVIPNEEEEEETKQQNNNNDDGDEDNDIAMQTKSNNDNKVNGDQLQKLSQQQQAVLSKLLKMSDEEIEKLEPDVQARIRGVQAQLAKQKE